MKSPPSGFRLVLPLALFAAAASCVAQPEEDRVPLVFSGGHATDPRDGGRPVALVAGALGVTPEVFRDAFSRVTPATGGRPPEPEQVRHNKDALLSALGPYGITNERLDRVSDYYRYRRDRGELWPTVSASGYAVVANGKVQRIVLTQGGAGYNSPPTVSVPGYAVSVWAILSFDRRFDRNGTIGKVECVPSARP